MSAGLTFRDFVQPLVWIDGRPLASTIEPYRWRLFDKAFERTAALAFVYNLILAGKAKKNWKTTDLILACWYALLDDSPAGNQCYLVANDEDQAADDLVLAKKLHRANPVLQDWTTVKKNIIERKDGNGFIEVLAAGDAIGSHGKTYRFLGVDEIHGFRNWDLLEALAPDPSRLDAQTWITSYASLFHRPGVPLFDLTAAGKRGTDPRMLFSWYAADHCTDPEFVEKTPEERANPSMASWGNAGYLTQQQRRLPSHKYRRLHLNLPGLPEGSAYSAEGVMDAIARGVSVRPPAPRDQRIEYRAFVDMSGGSSDEAVLAIGHLDAEQRAVLDVVMDQGQRPPFDPNEAVKRFVRVLHEYGLSAVTGDAYAGLTFARQFQALGVSYLNAHETKSEMYEALEPKLNTKDVVLLDQPALEQQLLGLVWRGGRIDHQQGEHDDHANAAAGVIRDLTWAIYPPALSGTEPGRALTLSVEDAPLPPASFEQREQEVQNWLQLRERIRLGDQSAIAEATASTHAESDWSPFEERR